MPERLSKPRAAWRYDKQCLPGGDPAKLARALVTLVDMERPPLRFIAAADAIATCEQKLADFRQQIDAHRELSSSLTFSDADTHRS